MSFAHLCAYQIQLLLSSKHLQEGHDVVVPQHLQNADLPQRSFPDLLRKHQGALENG